MLLRRFPMETERTYRKRRTRRAAKREQAKQQFHALRTSQNPCCQALQIEFKLKAVRSTKASTFGRTLPKPWPN